MIYSLGALPGVSSSMFTSSVQKSLVTAPTNVSLVALAPITKDDKLGPGNTAPLSPSAVVAPLAYKAPSLAIAPPPTPMVIARPGGAAPGPMPATAPTVPPFPTGPMPVVDPAPVQRPSPMPVAVAVGADPYYEEPEPLDIDPPTPVPWNPPPRRLPPPAPPQVVPVVQRDAAESGIPTWALVVGGLALAAAGAGVVLLKRRR